MVGLGRYVRRASAEAPLEMAELQLPHLLQQGQTAPQPQLQLADLAALATETPRAF
jgi:hypothetical protein